MTKDEALGHLRKVLAEKNPNLDRLVRDTETDVLGEATKRGRDYDASIASKLASTFVSLIRDRVTNALEETKRIFSMPGMSVNDSTKAGVKAILSELQNRLVGLAQGTLDRLAGNHPGTPIPRRLASEVESLAAAWSSEIDLLFVEAKRRAAAERRARNAAIVSIIGAAATWAGVIVQCYHPQPTTAPASPAPAASVTPAASPTNATLTPTPTPTPTPPSSSELLTTEIEKFLRYPVKHDDETSDEYRSREMGFVLREMDESKAKQREAEDAAIRAKRGITPTPTPSTPSPTPTPSTPLQPS